MENFTLSSVVNRLLTSAFTLTIILFAGKANAFTKHNPLNNTDIEYASLAATATDKAVFINWVTVSEQNNSHFEVERSTDMKAFKTVAMVLDGFSETGTNGKSYKFKEAVVDIRKGKTVYYRLKQIDNDNQVHYSTVMAVQINSTVIVFPKQNQSNTKNTSIISNKQTVYTNNQILLSKQSTSSVGITNIPVAGSPELTTGVFNALESILGTEFYTPKLSLA